MAGAPDIWVDQSGFSMRKKLYCHDVKVSKQKRQIFTIDIALNIHEKGFTIPKTIFDCKYESLLSLSVQFGAKNGSPASDMTKIALAI